MSKTYTEDDLIECAVKFIWARRKKLDAKEERRKLLCQCEGVADETSTHALCFHMHGDDYDKWCEYCNASRGPNSEFYHFSAVAGNALRKMERIVNHKRDTT